MDDVETNLVSLPPICFSHLHTFPHIFFHFFFCFSHFHPSFFHASPSSLLLDEIEVQKSTQITELFPPHTGWVGPYNIKAHLQFWLLNSHSSDCVVARPASDQTPLERKKGISAFNQIDLWREKRPRRFCESGREAAGMLAGGLSISFSLGGALRIIDDPHFSVGER